MSDADVKDMMKELDKDGDGKLDLKEFSEFIRQVLAGTVG